MHLTSCIPKKKSPYYFESKKTCSLRAILLLNKIFRKEKRFASKYISLSIKCIFLLVRPFVLRGNICLRVIQIVDNNTSYVRRTLIFSLKENMKIVGPKSEVIRYVKIIFLTYYGGCRSLTYGDYYSGSRRQILI